MAGLGMLAAAVGMEWARFRAELWARSRALLRARFRALAAAAAADPVAEFEIPHVKNLPNCHRADRQALRVATDMLRSPKMYLLGQILLDPF